jgi:hypothetical protein
MTRQEAGRLGGLKTFQTHGRDHMAKIGRKGFRKLCTHFPSNSRRLAIKYMNNKGRMKARYIPAPHPDEERIAAELYHQFDLD